MRVDRILYQKIFPTGMMYLNHKIGVEIQVDPSDNIDEAFRLAKETVEQWNLESNPSYGVAMEYMKPIVTDVNNGGSLSGEVLATKDERIQSFIATINMCTSLKFLENFGTRVREEKNDELSNAYMKKHEELFLKSKPETKPPQRIIEGL